MSTNPEWFYTFVHELDQELGHMTLTDKESGLSVEAHCGAEPLHKAIARAELSDELKAKIAEAKA